VDYAAFLRTVERGEPPAIALLHGGDGQLLDDALDAVTRALFPDRSLAAWGREVFDGREHGVDEIVRSAMTLPLGGGGAHRVCCEPEPGDLSRAAGRRVAPRLA